MAKFRYRATNKGTLSNPYRLVSEGEIIESAVPLKASWLIPADAKVPEKPSILVPYMKIDGRVGIPKETTVEVSDVPKPAKATVNDIHVPKDYQHQIDTMNKFEAKTEAAAEIAPPIASNNTGDDAGTGNQEVL